MYTTLISIHSGLRWIVLVCLLAAIYRSYKGWRGKRVFSRGDNLLRHWTATIAHIQLMVGVMLYTQSPAVSYFWHNFSDAVRTRDSLFFGLLHIIMMVTAVVLVTIGSALAKRRPDDNEKFRTVLTWFSIGTLIILIAIPWPFSPLSERPYFR